MMKSFLGVQFIRRIRGSHVRLIPIWMGMVLERGLGLVPHCLAQMKGPRKGHHPLKYFQMNAYLRFSDASPEMKQGVSLLVCPRGGLCY